MKAQLRDTRGAVHTTTSALPLIITPYQSMSHLAIFLSVSIPSFLFCNLSIFHGSIILVPLILHSSHPPSFRQQPSSLSRQCAVFFLVFVVLGWLKFNRVLWVFQVFSSEVSQSCAWGTEGGLKTNRTDFSTRLPPQRSHTRTHTHTEYTYSLQASRPDSSLFTPVGAVAWICICSNNCASVTADD